MEKYDTISMIKRWIIKNYLPKMMGIICSYPLSQIVDKTFNYSSPKAKHDFMRRRQMLNISNYIQDFDSTINTDEYVIVIIANVKGKTIESENYPDNSISAEFMNLINFENIVETFRDMGFETIAYFNENDFIKDSVNNNYWKDYSKKVIVYNTAQNGTKIGRKSLIPAFCYQNDIVICGSNPYVVSLTRHKFHCDQLLSAMGINTPKSFFFLGNGRWYLERCPENNMKVLAKLNYEASSIGMSEDNLFEYNFNKISFLNKLSEFYRQPIDVQEYIEGYELEVPCIRSENTIETAFPVGIEYNGDSFFKNQALTYDIRMKKDYAHYNYYNINPEIAATIEETAKQVMEYINIEGFGRVDFRVDKHGNYYVTDIAAHPGIGPASAFVYVFQNYGYVFSDLLKVIIILALNKKV